jgi:hypothetical protein
MKIFIVFVCLYLSSVPVVYAETVKQLKPVASSGDTVIISDSKKIKVQVKITTHEVQIDKRPDKICSSCTYSRYPCSIVDCIDIVVNDKPLFVPRSLFCDLSDLNTAEILIGQNKSILTLTGGDASESYVVKIEFDSMQIKRRSLASGMMPGEALQETVYYMRTLGD